MVQSDDPRTKQANIAYIRDVMKQPLLSREAEHELALRWRAENDTRALHLLIASYGRLVVAHAYRLRRYGLPIGDLIQEGNIGLLKAAERFDPNLGVRFWTYAAWWIRAAMQDFVLRNWSIVRIGTTAAHKALFFELRGRREALEKEAGHGFTDECRGKVASALKVTLQDVFDIEIRLYNPDRSFDVPTGAGASFGLESLIADNRLDPEAALQQSRDTPIRLRHLADAVQALPPRERLIITKRRLNEKSATLDELGTLLGISKERVRQLEVKALRQLRKLMETAIDAPCGMVGE